MIEFILKSRVKYVAFALVCLFFVILILTGTGDHTEDEEQLGRIENKKNINSERAEILRKQRAAAKDKNHPPEQVEDFEVKFFSGKELGNQLDNEKKSFQVHKVKITNMEKTKVLLECQDVFSEFGKVIPAGAFYEFRVTDLFAKRHYWCSAKYGTSEFIFRAYGEGAPRDNNQISLHKDGAFINGKNQLIEGHPMRFKQPTKNDPNGPRKVEISS